MAEPKVKSDKPEYSTAYIYGRFVRKNVDYRATGAGISVKQGGREVYRGAEYKPVEGLAWERCGVGRAYISKSAEWLVSLALAALLSSCVCGFVKLCGGGALEMLILSAVVAALWIAPPLRILGKMLIIAFRIRKSGCIVQKLFKYNPNGFYTEPEALSDLHIKR